MTSGKNAEDATGLHCLIRPRLGGGYVAECLEWGMYNVENLIDLAARGLDEAARAHEVAMEFFAGQGLPVHSVRTSGYWWKRAAWSIVRTLPGSLADRLNVRAILAQAEMEVGQ